MIILEIDILPGDAVSEMKEYRSHMYGPASNLINIFKERYLEATKNKILDNDLKIKFEYGTDGGMYDYEYTVFVRQININKRWAIIDRAISYLKRDVKEDGLGNIDRKDITFVKITIPEIGD